MTEQEAACGFSVVEHGDGTLVRIDLGGGIYAVKTTADEGAVEYIICDARLTPLYRSAKTLRELKERFASR